MKHIKKLNEAIADENIIAGFSDALVVYLDVNAEDNGFTKVKSELESIAGKHDCDVLFSDNMVTFIPESGEAEVLAVIKKELGLV